MADIDPDAILDFDETKSRWPYAHYKCGCSEYLGDIYAPHATPCAKHGYDDAA